MNLWNWFMETPEKVLILIIVIPIAVYVIADRNK